MMLTFIHTYTAESFPGLRESGLWRDGDGLKLMHKPEYLPPHDFNYSAAVGSPLEKLLRELDCPFYIDRLQGGIGFTRDYPYDRALTAHYRAMLGEKFLGFQMHEWASNLRSDEKRIRELFEKEKLDEKSPEARRRLWEGVNRGALSLFLEAYSPAAWEKLLPSENLAEFLHGAEALYALRARETEGLLFPADSYYMAPQIEIENGAGLLLPEVGWQIPNLRFQIAFTRGMANAAGIPWGIYFECWQNTRNSGFTIPFSLREGQDEWLEDQLHCGNGCQLPPQRREHGGVSLSLAARAWRFALFSGARFFGEEYGVCNTFRELRDFTLSPYGEMKKDFLRFAETFDDLGEPFVPIAAVLPKEMRIVDICFGGDCLGYPFTDSACPLPPEKMREFIACIEKIFGVRGKLGNYGHVLKTGGLPAVCDVIYEDMPEAMNRYDYLMDLTGKDNLSAGFHNVVTAREAKTILSDMLPFITDERLLCAYNRSKSGWFALIMNNDGILHDGFAADVLLPEATVDAPLRFARENRSLRKLAGTGELYSVGESAAVSMKAGEWLLLAVN